MKIKMSFRELFFPKKCPVCGMIKKDGRGVEFKGVWYCSDEHRDKALGGKKY